MHHQYFTARGGCNAEATRAFEAFFGERFNRGICYIDLQVWEKGWIGLGVMKEVRFFLGVSPVVCLFVCCPYGGIEIRRDEGGFIGWTYLALFLAAFVLVVGQDPTFKDKVAAEP